MKRPQGEPASDASPSVTPRESVTLADVAAVARVSTATASKALNGRPGISDSTRDRVRRVAASLDYGRVWSDSSPRDSMVVGVVVMMLDSHWVTPIVSGMEHALAASRTTILITPPATNVINARGRFESLLNQRVDGIVVIADSTNPISPIGSSSPVPIVYAYGPSADAKDVSYVPDNVQAGRLLGEHLISRQRTKIAFINGDPAFAAAVDRVQGLKSALGEMELVGRAPVYGDWTEGWGRRGMTTLLNSGAEFDAVVAGADRVARGVMDVLRASGKQIPHDVAVAGFDNWDELAMNAWPPLTTIDMNLPEIGRRAGAELRRQISGERADSGIHVLPVRLIPRESTASFRAT